MKLQKVSQIVFHVLAIQKLDSNCLFFIYHLFYDQAVYVVCCAIWYHLYNLKNVKNTHGGVLLLVKLQKSNTPPWVFLTFFKLCKWHQIAQSVTYSIAFIHLGIHRSRQFFKNHLVALPWRITRP